MKITETGSAYSANDASEREDHEPPAVGSEPRSVELMREAAESAGDCRSIASSKRWIKISLFQIPADGRVHIFLRDSQAAIWDMGDADADLVGIALETASRTVPLRLNCFSFNRRELILGSYASCDEIRLDICVTCTNNAIRGYVDLPLGTSVTFQSGVDRTSLIGFSSFALTFPE